MTETVENKESFRVIQSIASTRQDHGGTSRSVPSLCNSLVDWGIDNHLLTAIPSDNRIEVLLPKVRERVHLVRESGNGRQFGIGRKFQIELAKLTVDRDKCVVHDHALWLPSNHAVASFCQRKQIRRIASPRGMLTPWALNHRRIKKKLAWWLFQRSDLRNAYALHATSELERDELRQLGIRQPIAVIPNGIELQEDITPSRSQKGTKKALFVGRIHPKKGLPMLAEAWAATNPKGWTMHIVGPDEGQHRAEIEKQLERLGISEQWFFHGSIEGKQKWDWYSEADFTILPTYSENFGITVIESLAMGTPVITTTGTPWGRLLEKECGWWVAPTENALGVALRDATSISPVILTSMGQLGATWISEEYTWRSITGKFLELYKWVLNQGNVPSFVDVVQ